MGQRSEEAALRGFTGGSLEDLPAMPADVIKFHNRLAGHGRDQCPARQEADPPPGLAAGHVEIRNPDSPLRRQAQRTEVEQRVVQRAQRQAVSHHVGAGLAVPAQ